MKKIILIITASLIISCNKNVEIGSKNHLELLNLKGNISSIDISINENELIDNKYIPKSKGMSSVVSNLVSDLNPYFGLKIIDKGDSYIDVYDSYNILKSHVPKKIGIETSDIKIIFNKKGFISNIKIYENKKLIEEKKFEYGANSRLVKLFWSSIYFNDDYNLEKVIYNYSYNDDGLLTKNTITSPQGDDIIKIFDYNFDNNKIIISSKNRDDIFITIDNYKKIKKISDNRTSDIYFTNDLIDRITNYTSDNNILSDIQYEYDNEKVIKSKSTFNFEKNSKQETIGFSYNDKGYINNLESNNDNLKSNLNFDYSFDEKDNWTNLKFQIDSKFYKAANNKLNQIRNRREKVMKNLKGRELLNYIFDNKDEYDANMNLEMIKKYSSQIEINREISYY